MNRPKNDRLNCIRKMPELRHKIPGEPFDIMKSEVVDWMAQQPEIRQWLFDKVADKTAGKGNSILITYNPERKTWQGVDYDD